MLMVVGLTIGHSEFSFGAKSHRSVMIKLKNDDDVMMGTCKGSVCMSSPEVWAGAFTTTLIRVVSSLVTNPS